MTNKLVIYVLCLMSLFNNSGSIDVQTL